MRAHGWALSIVMATLGVSATAQPLDALRVVPSAVEGQQPAQPPAASTMQAPAAPMRIYIRGGLKTHGPGLHDYPQYLADWSNVLTERGAIVDGSLHFPTAAEIANTDVIVMYKGDAGGMTADEKATLDAYLKRGGGLVSFHDTLCGPDPDYYATIVGGAKKHGQVNYTLETDIPYTIADTSNPIMQGMSNFTINDEAFFLMTWAKSPAIKVLATAVIAPTPSAKGHEGEVVPQIWTYERSLDGGRPYRAFVWMQGHRYANFVDPRIQPMLLRGIAWAAGRPVDALMTVKPARGRGGEPARQGRGQM
jgi:type 1 glutamine amidotransferase